MRRAAGAVNAGAGPGVSRGQKREPGPAWWPWLSPRCLRRAPRRGKP